MAAELWLCFKLPSCLFGNTNDTSVMREKAKFVCFIYMQPQKVKFKFVQINMKHVLYDLISKFQVGLKSLLHQGLSEPDFYGDLVYKLRKIVGSNNFSAQFIKIISHYKKIGYNINVLQQTACLVVSPITVVNFAFLFNCTPVGWTSDSMMVPT